MMIKHLLSYRVPLSSQDFLRFFSDHYIFEAADVVWSRGKLFTK